MNGLPLHPALVHLPLGLAMVVPIVAASLLWAIATGRLSGRAWLVVVGLQLALLLGAGSSLSTGEGDEKRVERVVGKSLVEAHEGRAQGFAAAGGVTLVLAILASIALRKDNEASKARGTLAKSAMGLAVAGSMAVAGLGLSVGHSGGALVYQNGGASAWTQTAGETGNGQPVGERDGEKNERSPLGKKTKRH